MKVIHAHAKINWSLDITGRREDGYHLLDMMMQRIDLCDELRIEPAGELLLTVDGAPARSDDLVLRAARALMERTGQARGAHMALTKRIPAQAGLGGGSADCAAALEALNECWGLGLSRRALLDIGLSLGADVPFCLTGGLARVRGIGERIDPVPDAPRVPLVLVVPGALSTAKVFALWDAGGWPPVGHDASALGRVLAAGEIASLRGLCVNALTAPALSLLPTIGEALKRLDGLGAAVSFMTGSGAAAVGAFETEDAARRAAEAIPGSYLTHTVGSP